jgi:hypothetical protein
MNSLVYSPWAINMSIRVDQARIIQTIKETRIKFFIQAFQPDSLCFVAIGLG